MSTRPVVVLCQPLYGIVPPLAHANLLEFQGVNMARGLLHGYRARVGAYIDDARNALVAWVLDETPATHLLFVDQDMILPTDLLAALLADDAAVVSAVYFGKDDAASLVGWSSVDPPVRLDDFDPTALRPVGGFGMGACLIRTDVLRQMVEHFGDREWFRSERSGEDLHFSRRLARMGVPFTLDGRVQCGHVGDFVVTADHWRAARERKA